MYTEAYTSGPPTPQFNENARPQAPPQASNSSRFATPAHQLHRPLSESQWNHLTESSATSINGYTHAQQPQRSSGLAVANWEPQDSTFSTAGALTQQNLLPQYTATASSKISLGDAFFSAPDTSDLYGLATSSPQGEYKYQDNDYSPPLLRTDTTHFMNLQPPETMQTPPVSAHPSPNDAAMDEQQSRKRSHSVMSNEQTFEQQMIAATTAQDVTLSNGTRPESRSASVISAGAETDGYTGRGSRAFKRGDPPQNEQGKYICDYTEDCHNVTFDRKCEWSKHMDKHDRPYRCPHQSCGKLQGFTYSGGLLRHEREVHGKHGGPKAQLMCPHADCKRHAGKGFTRKENLNEHLRRVHFSRTLDSQTAGLGADDDEAGVDSATQEALAALGASNKRKRSLDDDAEKPSEIMLLRQELAVLRAENERKDAVIQDLTRQLTHDQQTHEQTVQESLSSYHQT